MTITKDFTRMQKLAGLITENEDTQGSNTNPRVKDAWDLDWDFNERLEPIKGETNSRDLVETSWDELPQEIQQKVIDYYKEEYEELDAIHQAQTGGEEDEVGEDDDLGWYYGNKQYDENLNESQFNRMQQLAGLNPGTVSLITESVDDVKKKTPIKKGALKNQIKEMILAEKNLKKKDKDKDKEEDIDIEAEDSLEPTPSSGNMSSIQTHLSKAQEEAKAMGDEKLINQIGNTLVYLVRSNMSNTGEINERQVFKTAEFEEILSACDEIEHQMYAFNDQEVELKISKCVKIIKNLVRKHGFQDIDESEDGSNDLESLLKKHDWWYMMSDDNRAYKAGEESDKAIEAIMKSDNSPENVELYNKYAPTEFKM